ncbi:MAG TPA: hypothetical protein PK867_05210 [Pirellulales bacterium]|nr:hypothetical protein [Pirellulales bacterium]
MTVNFDIYPRQALTPADFKALGRSLRRWLRLHVKQQGSVRWYDTDGLEDLLKGGPPRPVASTPEQSESQAFAGGGTAVLEHVDTETPQPICLSLIYNKPMEHRQVLAAVRRALSSELVADVLVNGQSWDDAGHGGLHGGRRAAR